MIRRSRQRGLMVQIHESMSWACKQPADKTGRSTVDTSGPQAAGEPVLGLTALTAATPAPTPIRHGEHQRLPVWASDPLRLPSPALACPQKPAEALATQPEPSPPHPAPCAPSATHAHAFFAVARCWTTTTTYHPRPNPPANRLCKPQRETLTTQLRSRKIAPPAWIKRLTRRALPSALNRGNAGSVR